MQKRHLKIGIDAHRLTQKEELHRSGGIYLSNLIANMAYIAPQDDFFIYLNKTVSVFNPNLLNCHLRPIPGSSIIWRQAYLPLAARKDHVDVLFIPFHSVPVFYPGSMVAVIHDLSFLITPEYFSQKTRRYLSRVTSYTVKRVNHIITVSESTKADILKFYGRHLASKISVIYEAPQSDFRELDSKESANFPFADQISEKCNYFLAVGTHSIKNTQGILEAFSIAQKKYKLDIKLVIIGAKSDFLSSCLNKKDEYLPKQSIVFLENVSNKNLQELYSRAVALIFPSFYEGFGLPLAEAIACGCPVITSNISAMPEIAGKAGILINPHHPEEIAEAIKNIYTNKKMRYDLSQASLVQAKLFSWEKAARQTMSVFEKIA